MSPEWEEASSLSPGMAWADNTVNTVIFRRNALASHGDWQVCAFYDPEGRVVLAERMLPRGDWTSRTCGFSGDIRDAHRNISIAIDGEGVLHMAWDHHDSPLRLVRARAPLSLDLGEEEMIPGLENALVTYPEFHPMACGDLLFLCRDGRSGAGNLVMHRYRPGCGWEGVNDIVIDGEGQRNAYWQAWLDTRDVLHLSWVWRESWDVATNHDICHMESADGGITWTDRGGTRRELPVRMDTAPLAVEVPRGHHLINQTGQGAGDDGTPFIATWWADRPDSIPRYRLAWNRGGKWRNCTVGVQNTPFSLGGGGTKRIPLARPQVVVAGSGRDCRVAVITRDSGEGSRPRIWHAPVDALEAWTDREGGGLPGPWTAVDLDEGSLGFWEPCFDPEAWKRRGVLYLFCLETGQGDGEGLEAMGPRPVHIREWTFPGE